MNIKTKWKPWYRRTLIRKCEDAGCPIITFYDDEEEECCPVCKVEVSA